MGIKISNMTETGSAPTGSYIPIVHDGENYKVNPSSAITGLRYVEDWASTIGGVAVAHGATFTITHNLGTTAIIVQAYVNTSASDTDAQTFSQSVATTGTTNYGWVVTSKTLNTITIQLGAGYMDYPSNGVGTGVSWSSGLTKLLKFIIFA
jgi:hypothetical protein